MKIETVSHKYGVAGQIGPEDLRVIAQAGYKSIICMRPDNEESGQPKFGDIARTANAFEVKTAHIPVSGSATRSQLMQFRDMCERLPKPVLGYCNSGNRALSIYTSTRQ